MKKNYNFKTKLSQKQWCAKLDKLFSQVIRTRDKRCLKCGNPEGGAAHLYPKGRYTKMRFDSENAIMLCWNCHLNWAHKSPLEFTDWLHLNLDPKRLLKLKLRAQVVDRSPMDYQAIELDLKNQIKLLNYSPMA